MVSLGTICVRRVINVVKLGVRFKKLLEQNGLKIFAQIHRPSIRKSEAICINRLVGFPKLGGSLIILH